MNGIGTSLQALADTGAHGYLFLNTSLAANIVRSMGIRYETLPKPARVTGFDGKQTSTISQYLRLHLTINGRRIHNVPFLVLPLGKHDCIIGIKFMRRFRLLLDPARNRFRWPSEYPKTQSFMRDIVTPYRRQFVHSRDPYAQADADRRDRVLEKDEQRRHAGVQINIVTQTTQPPGILSIRAPAHIRTSTGRVTWAKSAAIRFDRMNRELQKAENSEPIPPPRYTKEGVPPSRYSSGAAPKLPSIVDICEVSANALHFNMKRSGTEFF
jgi:hypothetical protein